MDSIKHSLHFVITKFDSRFTAEKYRVLLKGVISQEIEHLKEKNINLSNVYSQEFSGERQSQVQLSAKLSILKFMNANHDQVLALDALDDGSSRQLIERRLRKSMEHKVNISVFNFGEYDKARFELHEFLRKKSHDGARLIELKLSLLARIAELENSINHAKQTIENSQAKELEVNEQRQAIKTDIDSNDKRKKELEKLQSDYEAERNELLAELKKLDVDAPTVMWEVEDVFKKDLVANTVGVIWNAFWSGLDTLVYYTSGEQNIGEWVESSEKPGIYYSYCGTKPTDDHKSGSTCTIDRVKFVYPYNQSPYTHITKSCKYGKFFYEHKDIQANKYSVQYVITPGLLNNGMNSNRNAKVTVHGLKKNKPDIKTRINEIKATLSDNDNKLQYKKRKTEVKQLEKQSQQLKDNLQQLKEKGKISEVSLQSTQKSYAEMKLSAEESLPGLTKELNLAKAQLTAVTKVINSQIKTYHLIKDIATALSIEWPLISNFIRQLDKLLGQSALRSSDGLSRNHQKKISGNIEILNLTGSGVFSQLQTTSNKEQKLVELNEKEQLLKEKEQKLQLKLQQIQQDLKDVQQQRSQLQTVSFAKK